MQVGRAGRYLHFRKWPMADPTRPARRGSLIDVHRPRAMQAIDAVGAPAYDPKWMKLANRQLHAPGHVEL